MPEGLSDMYITVSNPYPKGSPTMAGGAPGLPMGRSGARPGGAAAPDTTVLRPLFAASLAGLSAQQRHLLSAVGRADTLGEAAQQMGIAAASLRARLVSIASRLGLGGVGPLISLARQRETLESSSDAICGVDSSERCTFASRRFAEMFGYSAEELLGQDLHELLHRPDVGAGPGRLGGCIVAATMIGGKSSRAEAERMWRRDGSALWVGVSVEPVRIGDAVVGAAVAVEDRSAMDEMETRVERARAQISLALEASDSVAVEVELETGAFTFTGASVLTLTCEEMSAMVAEEHRHKIAPATLKALPPGQLIEEDVHLDGCGPTPRRWRARMRLVNDRYGRPHSIVGVARDITTAEHPDTAEVADLRRWLADRRLVVHYQPIVAMDGSPVGVEALARVDNPAGGLVPPSWLVPLAEESGLISEVTATVLSEACQQLAGWNRARQQRGLNPLWVSVNVSATELAGDRLCREVSAALGVSGLHPPHLMLELTETEPVGDWATAERIVRELRQMGVGFAVDDFGTGFAGLEPLSRLAASALKLDRRFVAELGQSERSDVIASAVAAMADRMGIAAVAEGVETGLQAARLQSMGWELAQGHLWSPAGPVEEIGPQLTSGRPFTASGPGAVVTARGFG